MGIIPKTIDLSICVFLCWGGFAATGYCLSLQNTLKKFCHWGASLAFAVP
jgi:hypothetical protein